MIKRSRKTTISQQEINEMVAKYRSGMSVKEISHLHQRDAKNCSRFLREAGVQVLTKAKMFDLKKDRIISLYGDGKTAREICQELGASSHSVLSLLKERGIRVRTNVDYLPDISIQHDTIAARYQAGESARDLSHEFNIGLRHLNRILAQKGVKRRSFKEAHQHRVKERMFIPVATYSKWKHNALDRGFEWAMSYEKLEALYLKQNGLCHYTKVPMLTGRRVHKIAHKPTSLSLDRLDATKGYTDDNVVLCCRAINLAKNHWSADEFCDFLSQVALHFNSISRSEDIPTA